MGTGHQIVELNKTGTFGIDDCWICGALEERIMDAAKGRIRRSILTELTAALICGAAVALGMAFSGAV